MRKKLQIFLCFFFSALIISSLNAQQTISDDNRKLSIKERMIQIEEGQKNLNKQIDYLKIQMNNRFNDLRANFNWLYILLASIIILNGVMIACVIWMSFQDRPIGKRHYNQILEQIFNLGEKIRKMTKDVEIIKERLELTS